MFENLPCYAWTALWNVESWYQVSWLARDAPSPFQNSRTVSWDDPSKKGKFIYWCKYSFTLWITTLIWTPAASALDSTDFRICSRAQNTNLLSFTLKFQYFSLLLELIILLVIRCQNIRDVMLWASAIRSIQSQDANWAKHADLETVEELICCFVFSHDQDVFRKIRGD